MCAFKCAAAVCQWISVEKPQTPQELITSAFECIPDPRAYTGLVGFGDCVLMCCKLSCLHLVIVYFDVLQTAMVTSGECAANCHLHLCRCAGCHTAYYCNATCQKADWKVHRWDKCACHVRDVSLVQWLQPLPHHRRVCADKGEEAHDKMMKWCDQAHDKMMQIALWALCITCV